MVVAVAAAIGGVVAAIVLLESGGGSAASERRIAKCTERMVRRVDLARNPTLSESVARQYVERSYCEPFDKRGWIYPDGTFKLAAYLRSYSCAMGEPGQASHRAPCKSLDNRAGTVLLDCGFLRFVRKSDAQRYIASLTRPSAVKCDNGMPLAHVGA